MISIVPKLRARLIRALVDARDRILIANNRIPNDETLLALLEIDDIIPKNSSTYRDLIKYIGESPLFNFIFSEISFRLRLTPYADEAKIQPLYFSDDFNDWPKAANEFIEGLEHLPHHYRCWIRLPIGIDPLLMEDEVLPIGDGISIAKFGEVLRNTYSTTSGSSVIDRQIYGGIMPFECRPDQMTGTCLIFDVYGYFGQLGPGASGIQAEQKVKAFFGLWASMGVLIQDYTKNEVVDPRQCVIYHRTQEKWTINSTFKISKLTENLISKLKYRNLADEIFSIANRREFLISNLREIAPAFTSNSDAVRLSLGAQWYLESCNRENYLLSFVQAMVVLEILLGDGSKNEGIGLSELMRNRCAYMIGRTSAEREDIIKMFTEIYRVRSKIVHRGHNIMSSDELAMFGTLQAYCCRVIIAELRLLGAA